VPDLLELASVRAFYGVAPVLHDVSFSVAAEGVTALLGANGAGKTTILRAICGMVRRSGSIRFAGEPIGTLGTEDIVRRGIAHVPEGRGTFASFSVEENLRLGGHLRKASQLAADLERAYSYFPRLGERRHQQAGTLSGGEQQMLAIGRALMLCPRLMLLDEPSSGLAPLIVADLFRIMRRVSRVERVSILLVEQHAGLALELADRACLLETGRVVLAGTAEELRRSDAVRRAYLGG
jgi:branched-chain amino acid transport system ATP-binding protein